MSAAPRRFRFCESMAGAGSVVLETLTRRHGVKVASATSIEVCCLAAGRVVGYDSILSASRMNNAIVIFLSTVEKANDLVERGLVLNDAFTPVLPLSMPSKKVTLSNVPPFVKDEFLVNMLSRYGKLVSPIKKIPLGNVSPLLKHVVSFRRYAFMVLNDNAELDVSFSFRVDDFDYLIYATTDKMRCFGCGKAGHLVRLCPDKVENAVNDETVRQQTSSELMPETGVDMLNVNVAKDTEERSVENVVKSVSETVNKPKSSTSVEPIDSLAVHMESEIQTSNVQEGNKASNFVSDVNLMETENSQPFKVPLKRKMTKNEGAVKLVKKVDVSELADEEDESDEYSSDSSSVLSQSECQIQGYDVQSIKLFLKTTKNKRNVNVENFFRNTLLFVERSRSLMSEGCFTEREVYRLKKIVRKLSIENSNEEV